MIKYLACLVLPPRKVFFFLSIFADIIGIMISLNYDKNCYKTPCPKVNCRKKNCCSGLKYVSLPAVLGDDSDNSKIAPKNGLYSNAIVIYEANGAIYIYSTEGVPVKIKEGEIDG